MGIFVTHSVPSFNKAGPTPKDVSHVEQQCSSRIQPRCLDAAHHLHPFSDMKKLNAAGTRIIERGEGSHIFDNHGKRYLDGFAGLWCVNIGYGRKEIAEAVVRQMNELPYYNTFFGTTTRRPCCLRRRSPRMPARTSTASSSPAPARRRTTPGSAWPASIGAPSASTTSPSPTGTARAATCRRTSSASGPAEQLEKKILEVGEENVAAFIAEPIQGAGGVIVPPATYWPEVARICKARNILFIADEVICGFGRTGHWFGHQHFGVEPDLAPIAKGLSSGYLPIGGVMVSDRVGNVLVEDVGDFNHGFTYSGHPVCAAAALENLRIIEDEKLVERVHDDIGPYLAAGLKSLEDLPIVGQVQQVGLMAAVQLAEDKASRKRFEDKEKAGVTVRNHCLENGLVLRATGDRMLFSPPLVITHAEVDQMIDITRKGLEHAWKVMKG
ncbi:aminotransferase class-III domain-containing protein [Ditylenchus destructor]|uniref:Aminotransferase class-III domain-containing protein n=1 Tax=Ditylenchus destructor TaxID=166010 RepID=A0AAD4QVM7_9BILA|nr:aminotransferase class-III domain-containing protein [Ditylenchus destructor]